MPERAGAKSQFKIGHCVNIAGSSTMEPFRLEMLVRIGADGPRRMGRGGWAASDGPRRMGRGGWAADASKDRGNEGNTP